MYKVKILNVLIVLLILIIIVLNVYIYHNNNYYVIKLKDQVTQEEIKQYTASLIMVGDGLVHRTVYEDAYNGNSYDFTKQIALIKPIVSEYDLAFYNQESILGGTKLGLSAYPRFNSPQEFGDAMIDAGFNIVSLANNHTLDKGEKGVINSDAYWKSQKNILTAGSYISFEEQEKINVKEVNNITYSLLAYTERTNGLYAPKGKEYLVNNFDEEQIKNDIRKIRDKVDVLIVSMHWGNEYTHNPTSVQANMANLLADEGVDIVIGHHPHVIQPITKIKDTLVFYSLGNFISAQESSLDYQKLIGLMSSVLITKTVDGEDINIEITNNENELIYTYRDRNLKNVKIVPFSKMNTSYNQDYIRLHKKYSDVVKKLDPNISVKALS